MRWRIEAPTAPAPGSSLCEGAARRCFAAWNIEESNDTSACPGSKCSQAPPWRAPSQPCYASASRMLRVPGHRRVGVLHDANRWCGQTEAAALAVLLDSGSGKKVPPRGRGACTARTRKVCFEKKHCQRRCLLLARAAQGRGGAPHCVRHLTGGKQPIPGLTRWNILPKVLGLHRLLKLLEEDRVLEDVVLSGRDMAAALLPKPESKQPGLQRHRCLAFSKASDSGALVSASPQTRLLKLHVGPTAGEHGRLSDAGHWLVDWVIGDRYIQEENKRSKGVTPARICGDKWKIWSEARTKGAKERRVQSLKEGLKAWELLRAGHIYAKVQHVTMTRCNMATWLMHCSRYMEALRHGREEKMTRRGQGSGVEGDAPGPKSQQAELSLRGRFRVACSKEDGFVCLCANIYIYIYIYIYR